METQNTLTSNSPSSGLIQTDDSNEILYFSINQDYK